MRLVLLVLPIALLAGVGRAAEPKPSPAYEHCLASPGGTSTVGMVACANMELEAQNARLNRAYQGAMSRLRLPRQKAALQKAQRAWIAFRDADCASQEDSEWSKLKQISANDCVLSRTIQRADELEKFRQAQ
ncbi:lysozyme inhibitor LprI family protein [Caulobacter sp. SSI4214]|uniref:lysozyme inhibitor LprI family protein n=1 Tax=Caulobacter sp. SSI4214 TaxID=2575739 RepID=UPI00143AF3F8|nr:lysozyme inhibitor LprI family protein [Caulobacter sp. SSI4214]